MNAHQLLTMERHTSESHSTQWGPLERYVAHCACGWKSEESYPQSVVASQLQLHLDRNLTAQAAIEDAERTLLHLRASLDELEPVVTIGRMMISAFQTDPGYWRMNLPVVVVSKIEQFLKEQS